jgi:hypothetical protein
LTVIRICADRGSSEAQLRYVLAILQGEGGWIDLRSAAHDFKLSADQGNSNGQ